MTDAAGAEAKGALSIDLLHDAVEDTPVTTEDIADKFGEQVAHIVGPRIEKEVLLRRGLVRG